MKKKGITMLAGILVIGCLAGAYLVLKLQNEKAAEEEEAAAQGDVITEVDSAEITGLSFQIADETYTFIQVDDTWKLESDETFPVDESALLAPLSQLAPLQAVRTLTEAEDISEYGLDDPQNTIVITNSENQQTVLTIGATNDTTGDDYLMVNEDASVIYTISSGLRTAFASDLYGVALSEELPVISAVDVTGVTVERETDGYQLYLEDALWKVADGAGTGAEFDAERTGAVSGVNDADADAVNDALSSLAGFTYNGFLEHNCADLTPYGLDEPSAVLEIRYKEETESSAETEADSETGDSAEETEAETVAETETEAAEVYETAVLKLRIGTTDVSGNYYVQLDGSKEVHTVSADLLDPFLSVGSADWIAEPETETEMESETETETEIETETEAGTDN